MLASLTQRWSNGTLRSGFAESGLPVAAQLIGHSFADADVLRVGHQFELARPELRTWPSL